MKKRFTQLASALALAMFAASLILPAAQAATLKPGDIIVVDQSASGVIKADPVTGAQEVISAGGLFVHPRGVAIDGAGNIIVADPGAFGGGGVIKVDPVTGVQTKISSGGFFVTPLDVTLDAAGNIIVADAGVPLDSGSIIKVDPATGAQTVISSGGLFVDPHGVAIDTVGDILVSEHHTTVGSAAPL